MSTETTRSENGQSTVEPEGGEVVGDPVDRRDARRPGRPFAQGRTVTREAVRAGRRARARRLGRSEVAPAKGDRRFSDPGLVGQPALLPDPARLPGRRAAVSNVVERARPRARTTPAAPSRPGSPSPSSPARSPPPTSSPPTPPRSSARSTPAARAWRAGSRNFVDDLRNNGGMPSMVEPGRVRGGSRPRAQSPGAVVAARRGGRGDAVPAEHRAGVRSARCSSSRRRSAASTSSTCARAAASSSTPCSQGIQMFLLSWRNPTAEQGEWDLDTYARAGARRDRRRARDHRQRRRQRDGLLRRRHHHHHAAQPPRRDR